MFTALLLLGSACTQAEIVILDSVYWNGNEYLLTSKGTVEELQEYAESLGGNLISINSQAENDFVYDTWGEGGTSDYAGYYNTITIGLTDVDEEGVFVWLSGDPFTFDGFAEGEPTDGSGNGEDYVTYILNNENEEKIGAWNDVNDTYSRGSIIEIGTMNDVPLPFMFTSILMVSFFKKRNIRQGVK
ncbi:lectin-like protein [Alteromonas sp. 14N.309.X.WAT.G.H12]|uniref:lectin-like protein n=1 Tax=Alteromonas sp. 14N.309.X.WAT.G.H12 TaxID=3120824 RepID=UPI002FD3C668